jgi:putative methyltransferase (TIGR04325 family)
MSVSVSSFLGDQPLRRMTRWGKDQLWQVGPVGALRKARYERRFATANTNVRMFRGIYENYDAAVASAPSTHPIGWDHAASTQRLEHERMRIFASDYPTLFWLDRLLTESSFLFDLHGNVATAYFAFRRVLPYPANLTWLVHDVPAILAKARSLTRNEDAPGLRFTEDLSELERADILLIKGALQFLRNPIQFLTRSGKLPRHVLVNKASIYERESAVTLHGNGVAFHPYHLLNRREFVAAFEDQGYRCVDTWLNFDLNCYVPFHPEHTIPRYSGYYFTRER